MTLSEREQEELDALAGGLADEETERRARELIARSSEAVVYYQEARARVALLESALGIEAGAIDEPAPPAEIEAFVQRVERLRRERERRRRRQMAIGWVSGLAAAIALVLTLNFWSPQKPTAPSVEFASAVLLSEGGYLHTVRTPYRRETYSPGQLVRAEAGGTLTVGGRIVAMRKETDVLLTHKADRLTLLRGALYIPSGTAITVMFDDAEVTIEPGASAYIGRTDPTNVVVFEGRAILRDDGRQTELEPGFVLTWRPEPSMETDAPTTVPAWAIEALERHRQAELDRERGL